MEQSRKNQLNEIARKARINIVESTYHAKSGHPGGSLSAVEVVTYLYFDKMNINPKDPSDPERDRFVLSKGHAAPVLYSILSQRGFFDGAEINTLRKVDSSLQGHPDMKLTPGVDMSTGSLGQGFSAAAGMALGLKIGAQKVYALLGDGEIQEGIVWETAMFAAHYKLSRLIAAVDNNKLQIDGAVSDVMSVYPIEAKFAAFGWNTITVDNGHDWDELEAAYRKADEYAATTDKPTVIVLNTVKGKGVSFMENKAEWHGKAANKEQLDAAVKELAVLMF
ncbi:MAG: transketolase [Oscillospiraceae bacterium]|jgi:transketolase|nr:transketolase [Oscillospiraceae bacterium]